MPQELDNELIDEALSASSGRIDFALNLAQGAAKRVGQLIRVTGNVDGVVLLLQGAYDKFAAPLDIPVLTAETEKLGDQFAKAAIGDIVRAAAAQE